MTSDLAELPLDDVRRSLARCLGVPADRLAVDQIEDLSPRIGSSRVFRVAVRQTRSASAGPVSYVLKVPDWGAATLIQPSDPLLETRERRFIENGLAARLPDGLRAPTTVGVEHVGDRTWLWMEDVGPAVDVTWDDQAALLAARRAALLHAVYLREEARLHRLDWLQREHYAAYLHHVPAAHRNFDACARHPVWSGLFSTMESGRLHRCLDRSDEAIRELRTLPLTLIHGDFHVANLGVDADGTLVALDWAHVGLAPLGCDVATLVSLYHLFGGTHARPWLNLERELVAACADEIARIAGHGNLTPGLHRAGSLWHRTWGLHLRLGPGLTYLLRDEQDSPSKRRTAADILEGCTRALA